MFSKDNALSSILAKSSLGFNLHSSFHRPALLYDKILGLTLQLESSWVGSFVHNE